MGTGWDGRTHFEALLCELFDEPAIRRWLRLHDDGEEVVALIPGPPIALRELVHAATDVLLRRGLIEARLFERLAHEFPRRRGDIQEVLRGWIGARPAGTPCPVPDVQDPQLWALSERLERAYQQREESVVADRDTAEVDREILELRRTLRQGPQLDPGDSLDHGRFRLIARVATGGYAAVWRAYDRERRESVALRVLHGHRSGDRSCRERFERGARNMARMQHPGIVPILRGVFDDGGYLAYAMELLPGGDLRERILAGTIDATRLLDLAVSLCDALQYAHDRGFVHRDIKPSNILLDARGTPKLTDFDLMLADDTTGGTASGLGIGTFLYTAPELMRNAAAADARSDVFSLGMTLLFCLSGQDVDFDTFVDPSPRISALSCDAGVKQALRRALQRRPEARFASAIDLRAALCSATHNPAQPTRPQALTVVHRGGPAEFFRHTARYLDSVDWGLAVYPTPNGPSVEVRRGDALLLALDVVIGTIDEQGEPITMAHSPLGCGTGVLIECGGSAVSEALATQRPFRRGEAVVTPSGRLGCRHLLFFVESPSTLPSKQLISELAVRCLTRAESLGLQDVAFPLHLATHAGDHAQWILQAMFEAVWDFLDSARRLRRVILLVDDGGTSLARHGGAIMVYFPTPADDIEQQCFLLAHHLSLFDLGTAIWTAIPRGLAIPAYSYGNLWLLRNTRTGAILDTAMVANSRTDRTLTPQDAGIHADDRFEVLLLR